MALSREMKIGLVVLGVLLLLGALFGTLAATGVLGGQKKTANAGDGSCVYFKSVTPNIELIKNVVPDDSDYKDTYENALDASGINGKTYYTTSLDLSKVKDINNKSSLMFINTPAEDIKTTDGTKNLFEAMNSNPDGINQKILQHFLIGDAAFYGEEGKYFLVSKVNVDNGAPLTFAKKIARGNNPATSPNALIIFGESDTDTGRENLTDDEIDFLEKCTVDTKFYIVTGDENYIKNNVSAIVDRGEELSVAAGT